MTRIPRDQISYKNNKLLLASSAAPPHTSTSPTLPPYPRLTPPPPFLLRPSPLLSGGGGVRRGTGSKLCGLNLMASRGAPGEPSKVIKAADKRSSGWFNRACVRVRARGCRGFHDSFSVASSVSASLRSASRRDRSDSMQSVHVWQGAEGPGRLSNPRLLLNHSAKGISPPPSSQGA